MILPIMSEVVAEPYFDLSFSIDSYRVRSRIIDSKLFQ